MLFTKCLITMVRRARGHGRPVAHVAHRRPGWAIAHGMPRGPVSPAWWGRTPRAPTSAMSSMMHAAVHVGRRRHPARWRRPSHATMVLHTHTTWWTMAVESWWRRHGWTGRSAHARGTTKPSARWTTESSTGRRRWRQRGQRVRSRRAGR